MMVRETNPRELEHLAQLDGSYSTDMVWQMEERGERGILAVHFRPMKLPRAIEVPYPREPRFLERPPSSQRLFIAEDEGVVGFAYILIQEETQGAWVRDLVVERSLRRQGIGTALLKAAAAALYSYGLRTMTLEAQTKNYPTIAFAEKNGFRFSGFTSHYYANGDIGVFFSRGLQYEGVQHQRWGV